MKLIVVATMLLAMPLAHADDLYRWVDKDGKVHYGDTLPGDAQDVEEKKFGSSAASAVEDTNLPYETRRAKQNFPVALYLAGNCGDICKQAKDFLNKRHVPYTETTLKTQKELDEFNQKSGSDSTPTLSIGKLWLKGFQPEQWREELDAAGYPK